MEQRIQSSITLLLLLLLYNMWKIQSTYLHRMNM